MVRGQHARDKCKNKDGAKHESGQTTPRPEAPQMEHRRLNAKYDSSFIPNK
jgi:hypothetical protein